MQHAEIPLSSAATSASSIHVRCGSLLLLASTWKTRLSIPSRAILDTCLSCRCCTVFFNRCYIQLLPEYLIPNFIISSLNFLIFVKNVISKARISDNDHHSHTNKYVLHYHYYITHFTVIKVSSQLTYAIMFSLHERGELKSTIYDNLFLSCNVNNQNRVINNTLALVYQTDKRKSSSQTISIAKFKSNKKMRRQNETFFSNE